MDIVIISHFTSTFSLTDNDRFLYLAKELSKSNNVEIVTSKFCHEKKCHRDIPEHSWPFKITFLNEPGYKKNVSLRRFFSHYIWGKNVNKYLKSRKKPDVVYCAVPSLTGPNGIAQYCNEKGIRFIIDVQDLWPEAFQMVFNVPIISSIIFLPFKRLADGIYKRADAICAVSQTYADRAQSVNKKCTDTTVVFLGTNLKTFDDNAEKYKPIIKSKDELWLGYCGTLGSSYDLKVVIDALAMIENPPKLIVLGDGPKKDEFENYAKLKGVNCEFFGRISYDRMCSTLMCCDMVVNPISKGAAQSIINKHADYAASGLPVLNTQECEEYRKLIDDYEMGFNCENNNPTDLAKKIEILVKDESLRKKMGKGARKSAQDYFDRGNTYSSLTEIVWGGGTIS